MQINIHKNTRRLSGHQAASLWLTIGLLASRSSQAAGTKEPSSDSSAGLVGNTTPSLPNDSIGSPVAFQPPVTTSSSIVAPSTNGQRSGAATGGPATEPQNVTQSQSSNQSSRDQPTPAKEAFLKQQQQQPANLRHNEPDPSLTQARSGGAGGIYAGNGDEFQTAPQASSRLNDEGYVSSSQAVSTRHSMSNSQPLSSSPSSISIITPLIGPPTSQLHQQQQVHTASLSASIGGGGGGPDSQSSMMKPIFVVGNPITERDYSNQYQYDIPLHEQQRQQTSGEPSSAQQPNIPKAPKSVEVSAMASPPQSSSQQPEQTMHTHSQAQQQAPKAPPNNQQHIANGPTGRADKSEELASDAILAGSTTEAALPAPNTAGVGHLNQAGADRMGGPPLVYSGGQLATAAPIEHQQQTGNGTLQTGAASALQPPTPRLYQSASNAGAAVVGSNPRRPSLPPPVNQANAASGFRSPLSPSGPLIGGGSTSAGVQQQQASLPSASLQPPVNSLNAGPQQQQHQTMPNFYQTSPPYAGSSMGYANGPREMAPQMIGGYNKAFVVSQTGLTGNQQPIQGLTGQQQTPIPSSAPGATSYPGSRRPLNITRVEHISAECSNDLIRAVIVFNGTFKGIIYSSGYVSDPTCLYVNGTGSTRYEFSIRLNQCGTLGRQELHQPTVPGEARRRDQVMWNTLSIQYNSIIEQEWDEHFRVSCEYGSDFWKTVSFSPFNVETNTGSPVVFTINPPQCQMDVLLGHGMGPKIAVDGPVTVGDPLTLLIHMKSEKAGYDILVKNCVAHNGGKQRMQLIDSNGCVVNERFISPFRGTYNDNDLRHVTLYAYLKAFRFTGSPVLYLECEIHMCQSACPPQMCYWRRLSKRSVDEFEYEYTTNSSSLAKLGDESQQQPVISDSLNLFKALQVRQEPERSARSRHQMGDIYAEDDEAALICYRHTEVCIFLITIASLLALVITIAITCCLRIRKLTKSQFEHNRLKTASSLSPSLLSISDALSNVGSMVSNNAPMMNTNQTSQSWHIQQQQNSINKNNQLHKQQRCIKPTLYLQRQLAPPPISSLQTRTFACLPLVGR